MATLQRIRNKGGLLVAIIIGMALIAFILGDMLRSGSSLLQSKQMEIAEIDGNSISYKDYQKRVDELTEIYKMNSGQTSLDQKMMDQIREETWQNLVRELVMDDVYDELGISVGSEELFDMVQGQTIHPIIQNIFRNPNSGQVNRSAIIQFLKHLTESGTSAQRAYWMFIEKQISTERTLTKYNNLINKGLYVTKSEAKADLENKNSQASIQFVAESYFSVPDSAINVSDSELKKHYDAHKDEYEQEEMRRIEYVVFPVVASQDDDDQAKLWVSNLKSEFKETGDAVGFVNMNSDTRFNDSYYKKSELSPEIAEFAFAGKEGDIYGPYKESNSWKISKINKFENLPDSVKARHILLRVNSQEEAAVAKAKADSLVNLLKKGANFSKLAEANSQDPGSATKGGDLGWFKRGTMVKEFNDAAFLGKVNEIQQVPTQFGIHIIQVTRKGKTVPNVQLASIERKIEPGSATYQDAYSNASKFVGDNRDLAAFNKAIAEQGLNKQVANVSKTTKSISDIENSRLIIRSAFNNTEVGELVMSYEGTPIFELGDLFIVGAVSSATEEGTMSFDDVKVRVEMAVKKDKKAEYLISKMAGKNSLEELASEIGTEVREASNLNFESYTIPGIGSEPSLIGTLSSLDVNKSSAPIKGNNGVYVVKVTGVEDAGMQDVDANQQQLNTSMGYRANYQAYETLRKSTEIVDNRSKFY
jgi:peptidyl-prolyl cis-trans isomerase D